MKKPSQKKRVENRLKERGKITRNECLNVFPRITRLGAIIHTLKQEGWNIEGKDEGNDYVYYAEIKPPRIKLITLGDGRVIQIKEKS